MRIILRLVLVCLFTILFVVPSFAQQPITLGIPTSLKLIEGAEGNKAAILATEEINAKGGVQVGKEKRLLKTESLDIRDGEPGVPTSEALLGIEKLILDKKIYAAFQQQALKALEEHLSFNQEAPEVNDSEIPF